MLKEHTYSIIFPCSQSVNCTLYSSHHLISETHYLTFILGSENPGFHLQCNKMLRKIPLIIQCLTNWWRLSKFQEREGRSCVGVLLGYQKETFPQRNGQGGKYLRGKGSRLMTPFSLQFYKWMGEFNIVLNVVFKTAFHERDGSYHEWV